MQAVSIKRGDTWAMTFEWQQSDGSPLDLSGCEAKLQVRGGRTDEVLIDASTENGLIRIGDEASGTQGDVVLEVPAETMATVPVGTWLFDMQLTFPDGVVISSQTIQLNVEEDITR